MIAGTARLLVRRPAGRRSRGVAALTVVMILFFVMALVAAYTNRNLMFEQRISANSYRANRALEAADAGVEWTVAMLNAGRVDANCQATADNAFGDFRSRYLMRSDTAVNIVNGADQANGEGGFMPQWGVALANPTLYPACVIRDGALSCICPLPGAAVPAIGAPADGIGSAFRIALILPGNAIRSGAMQFTSRGCANPGSGDRSCYAQRNDMPEVDGVSAALATVGLVRALPVAPIAPLTAGGAVSDSGGAGKLVVRNFDTQTDGLTVRSGVPLAAATSDFSRLSLGVDTWQGSVVELSNAANAANDGWFRGLFGIDPASYRQQPAVVRVPCAAGCTLADLNDTLARYPRNPIWVDGNLNIDNAVNLGSVANPLMLIVSGTLTVSANATIVGFVHADQVNWNSLASLQGALVTRTAFTATGEARLTYSKPVLDTVRLEYGSFVRVPGGWNLF